MALLTPSDWRTAEAISRIGFVNPFLPERVELERKALGAQYREEGPIIRARPGEGVEELFGNVPAMRKRAESLVPEIRRRLVDGHPATPDELLVYERLSLYRLYAKYMNSLDGLVTMSMKDRGPAVEVSFWDEFEADFRHLFHPPGHRLPSGLDPLVVFAGFFQIERAFTHIYGRILGGSMPAARLRAAVWQSIFTSDMGRYIRTLHGSMADVPTLITGPSGSGKELVARAIGLSCYIPFDVKTRRFEVLASDTYVPLNISALAPTLVESELFGHVKGSFTTAHKDRVGWLERCHRYGAVFLDEIGELDASIQVKLLRVIESRRFEKVGSTDPLPFRGKIIAATNRDLAVELHAGRFRHDLYYRLCADQVVTPSLAEQLADRREDLPEMVRFIVQGVLRRWDGAPEGQYPTLPTDDRLLEEEDKLTAETVAWIDRELGRDYAWPGNFRELGQCVRNVIIRGSYRPAADPRVRPRAAGPLDAFLEEVREVGLTADELLGRYYALAYDRLGGSYKSAGEKLGVNWRTIKDRLDGDFLKQIRRPRSTGRA